MFPHLPEPLRVPVQATPKGRNPSSVSADCHRSCLPVLDPPTRIAPSPISVERLKNVVVPFYFGCRPCRVGATIRLPQLADLTRADADASTPSRDPRHRGRGRHVTRPDGEAVQVPHRDQLQRRN